MITRWMRAKAPAPRLSVLMVCMGNICRSPTAEGVLRHKLEAAGLADQVRVDSAGTYGGHAGDPPDPRAQRHAQRRGVDLSAQRARLVAARDFEDFQLILAMDEANLADLDRLRGEDSPVRPQLLMDFSPRHRGLRAVPDPYYGGPEGFEFVLDLIEDACDGLVDHLRGRLGGTS